jgi:hypothetical protein
MIPDLKTLLTPLHYCYEMKEVQIQSAHIFIKAIMNSKVQSEYNKVLITQILSKVYERNDVSPEMFDFFVTNEDNADDI